MTEPTAANRVDAVVTNIKLIGGKNLFCGCYTDNLDNIWIKNLIDNDLDDIKKKLNLSKKEMTKMAKFKIYAGLSGGFGGAHFCEVYECGDRQEAEMYAREVAMEEYESYGGYHGLYTWDSMRQTIADDEYDGDIEQVDPGDVDIALAEEIEGWITYHIVPVPDDFPIDYDGYDDDDDEEYNDDDVDCYCE